MYQPTQIAGEEWPKTTGPLDRLTKVITAAVVVFLVANGLAVSPSARAQVPAAIDNSQSFNLFEAVETSEANTPQSRNRVTRENRNTSSSPEFTLVGTSRIGDNYSAILLHRDGNTVSVAAQANANTRIPGHADYTLVNIAAGAVSIRYPDNRPCEEQKDKGVSCNSAGNIAALVLATGEPVANSNSNRLAASQQELAGQNEAEGDANIEEAPTNPFETLRAAGQANRDAANGGNPGDTRRFQPRRIAPEDVPPGQRVVSTPFGDRLVDQ